MEIGTYQNLIISTIKDFGAYLVNDKNEKVLLPKKQIPKGASIGDTLKVFIYKDSKNRYIATTKNVFLTVGDVAVLTVKDINKTGAFLNFGLERDLLLPYSEQTKKLKIGDKVKVYMYVDKSNRLSATMYTNNKDVTTKIKNSTIRTYEYTQNADYVYKIIKYKFKGHLIYNDKLVSPAQVKKDFGISKVTFKKSIGKLLKDNKIKITEKGIFVY